MFHLRKIRKYNLQLLIPNEYEKQSCKSKKITINTLIHGLKYAMQ